MSTASGKRKAQQQQAGFRLLILLAILICINLLASRFHYGVDMTREKRFTLSPSTRHMLQKMDEVAVIDIYLEGKNYPPAFQRLKDAVRERLQSLKEVAGQHIRYRFVDPFEGKSNDELAAVYQDFASRGMSAINVGQNQTERSVTQLIVPYALVKYKDREIPVNLMEAHTGMTAAEQLTYSESMLEYKIASAINMAGKPDRPRIAYIMGNGEQLGYHTYDLLKTLSSRYRIDTIDLDGINIPAVYNAAIICKPTVPFTEKQKFKIDQYIMRGGNTLWFVDGMQANMDSLRNASELFMAVDNDLNLDDMFFKYGVRINRDLIEDLTCGSIYVIQRGMNDEPKPVLREWYYFPVFNPTSQHPIVRNMDLIEGKFVSTLDTIANAGIRKTILLESSQYSRPALSPVRVSLSMLRYKPNPELFNKGFRPAAVLLEGRFQSVFQDRIPLDFKKALDSLNQPFKPVAEKEGKMIVVGDGDMVLNEIDNQTGPVEMGYSRMEKIRYANKSFFLNAMEYLTDSSGLIEARSKDVRIRLLDGGRILKERGKWQLINVVVPIAFVLAFASCYIFFRKRRYEGS